jgi:uncharacterized membrane protein YqaE (UPF0057 family)
MKNVFLESGKSLLILGNLGFILLFLKQFLETGFSSDLIVAILFLLVAYMSGNSLIYISGLERDDG